MKNFTGIKVVAFAGGVGGAKMAFGLAQILPPENFSVIVNVGDNFYHYGLYITPDIDTVCYTLAGIANPITGWGRSDETWNALESMSTLGGLTWFRLGDRDLGLHLERTRLMNNGQSLSEITRHFSRSLGIQLTVLPVTDTHVPTWVYTDSGEMPFQEYFVRHQCQPRVTGFRFDGVAHARAVPGGLDLIGESNLIVICPSNPWVSIDPILAIPEIRDAIAMHDVIAISPIIGGKAIKGPAAKMYSELGIQPSARAVAEHYKGLIAGFVLDEVDKLDEEWIKAIVPHVLVTNSVMNSEHERISLASEVIKFYLKWR